MKNKLLISWAIVIFLVITFCLSFINTSAKDKRKPVKSALLNPKYKNELSTIIIYDSLNAVELTNNGTFWTINNPTDEQNKLPADNAKVQNLIEKLSEVRNMYKISDSFSEKNDFGLNKADTLHLVYYTKSDSSKFTDLVFGNHDFTQQFRYFLNGNTNVVYEIDTSLDSFLTSKSSLWSEGLIVSKNIIKNNEIQNILITDFVENKSHSLKPADSNFAEFSSKLLELRQGGLPDETTEGETKVLSLKISFGNLDELILEVYTSKHEGEYLLKEKYKLYNSTEYEYLTKISSWTFSKLQ